MYFELILMVYHSKLWWTYQDWKILKYINCTNIHWISILFSSVNIQDSINCELEPAAKLPKLYHDVAENGVSLRKKVGIWKR